MAIKAVAVDDENTQHLIIGLNRDNVNDLLDGDVFTLPRGMAVTLTEKSDIVLLFAETDEELEKRFPARLRPICGPFARPLTPIFRCAILANKWRIGQTLRQKSHSRKSNWQRSGATSPC
jgi:hypothetical protein